MTVLGMRCSPSEFSYSIVSGKLKAHSLIASAKLKHPSGFSHCELLNWFYSEIGDLISKYEITSIGVKGTEPMRMKGKSYGERVELEAMIFLQANQNGIKHAQRKVNGTIAKDLGLKGKGKYLASGFDYSSITSFEKMSPSIQEAIQVALSMLK